MTAIESGMTATESGMTATESGMTATESGMTATESGMTKQRLGCQLNLSLRPGIVIAGLTRNPVHAYHWIPDQVRDDNFRDRDDNGSGWDDN